VPLSELTVNKTQTCSPSSSGSTPPAPNHSRPTLHGSAVLHAALNGAIRRGLITSNPAHWVELPAGRRPKAVVWTEPRVAHWRATGIRPPVAVWTPTHTAAFLTHVRDHPWYELFHLIVLLGLRRGEAAGLRWADLDLKHDVLMVSHQLRDDHGRTVTCPPKTESSVRSVALDLHTAALLRRLRADARSSGAALSGFIFHTRRGTVINPSYLTIEFRRQTELADLPPIRLHDLRHGAASLSLAAGNDLKTVQAMLGHSSIVITADTYTSVLPCLAHQAAEATARLVMHAAHATSRSLRRPSRTRRQATPARAHPTARKAEKNHDCVRAHNAPTPPPHTNNANHA